MIAIKLDRKADRYIIDFQVYSHRFYDITDKLCYIAKDIEQAKDICKELSKKYLYKFILIDEDGNSEFYSTLVTPKSYQEMVVVTSNSVIVDEDGDWDIEL